MNFKYFLSAVLLSGLVTSCTTTKTAYFTKRENEVITTPALKEFLKKNKNPKVVLRITSANYPFSRTIEENDFEIEEGISQDDYNNLYNIIEKELMMNGFIVRDRELFKRILNNKENTLDYKKIGKQADTDLIIELTELNTNILHETNRYKENNTNEVTTSEIVYKNNTGQKMSFKAIIVDKNEFAGSYSFNYTPCVDGCVFEDRSKKDREKGIFPGIERVYIKKENEDFVRYATQLLIKSMRE